MQELDVCGYDSFRVHALPRDRVSVFILGLIDITAAVSTLRLPAILGFRFQERLCALVASIDDVPVDI